MDEYRFVSVPPIVGFVVVAPGFKVGLRIKPSWYKRFIWKLILRWEWEDFK